MVRAVLILGGLHAATNTNLLGEDNLCEGLLSVDAARAAFGGSGRFTSSGTAYSPAGPGTSCTLRRSNLVVGDNGAAIELRLNDESSEFPFDRGLWQVDGSVRPATDGSAAIATRSGWSVLPVRCDPRPGRKRDSQRWVVQAQVKKGHIDEAGMLRLVTQVRDRLMRSADCATQQKSPALSPPPASQTTDARNACSLTGFGVAATNGRAPAATEERTSGSMSHGWYCNLSLEQPLSEGGSAEGPYAKLAVVRDRQLVAGLAKSRYTALTCDGAPAFLLTDTVDHPWSPDERAEKGIAAPDVLHERFVAAVAEQQGCTRS